MLRIRQEQIRALRDGWRRTFAERMTRRIGELLAAGAGDRTDAEVRAFVETGIAAAIGHGIRSYPLLERYLELTAHCGEPLEDAPWAGPILADPFLAAGDKLAALEKLSRGPAR